MCGITGYWGRRGAPAERRQDLEQAVELLQHRGPDDRGSWLGEPGVGLGQTRLSILDLSPLGHQPMLSADGRHALIFNGEVYNFAAVRRELEARGRRFRGSGDTEVVLAALQEWGHGAVDRFIGMFAIAWWDGAARRLTLYRDRLGVKPLYYGWDGDTLWFGSELKALRAYRHWQPTLDRQALGEFLQYGYIADPRCIYRQVRKLPPGCRLELGMAGEPEVVRYWSVLDAAAAPLSGSETELESELEALLIDAARYRLVADVPVGVFLSGGIDSSLLTALLQRHGGQRLRTFTIGFRHQRYDEAPWARQVAAYLDTDHQERILEAGEAQAILARWGALYDEPFADASGIPTLLVARLAREQVKVALSADGGDELFGGYDHYTLAPRRAAGMRRLPYWLRRLAGAAARRLPREAVAAPGRWLPATRELKLADRVAKAALALPLAATSQVFDAALSTWLPGELDGLLGGYTPPREFADTYQGTPEEQMMLWDLHHYLAGDILTKVDRATMAVGLEGREPLLDHRLVEFAFRLPLALRRGSLGSKHLLRRVLYRYLPRELVDRPKQGFAVPLSGWLRGDLAWLLDHYLEPARIRAAGMLDPRAVAAAAAEFRQGGSADGNRIWYLLAFELWREQWDV